MIAEEIAERTPDHLRACGVPDIIRKFLTGCELKSTQSLTHVGQWFITAERTLVLCGRNGAGKSLAAAWAIAQNTVGYDVFLHAPGDLPRDFRFRSGFFTTAQELAWPKETHVDILPLVRRARMTSMLVVDEAGREDGDGARGLGHVLAERADADGRRTIITSNMLKADFIKRYRGRIISRIEGSGRICEVAGEDLRQQPGSTP